MVTLKQYSLVLRKVVQYFDIQTGLQGNFKHSKSSSMILYFPSWDGLKKLATLSRETSGFLKDQNKSL